MLLSKIFTRQNRHVNQRCTQDWGWKRRYPMDMKKCYDSLKSSQEDTGRPSKITSSNINRVEWPWCLTEIHPILTIHNHVVSTRVRRPSFHFFGVMGSSIFIFLSQQVWTQSTRLHGYSRNLHHLKFTQNSKEFPVKIHHSNCLNSNLLTQSP